MRTLTLVLFTTLLLLGSHATTGAEWSEVNRDRFNQDAVPVRVEFPAWFKHSFLDLRYDLREAQQAGKLGVLLFLSAPQCSYCKAFLDFTFADPQIRQGLDRHFDVIGVEVISDTPITDAHGRNWKMKEFVAAQKAYVTPTLIFLRHDARPMLRIVGYYPPEKFRGVMDYLVNGHWEREKLGAFLTRTTAQGKPGALLRDPELFNAPLAALDRRKPAKRPLLVLLERPNCTSCEQFHAKVLQAPEIRALVKQFDAVQLDMSDAQTKLITPAGRQLSPRQWAEQLDLAYAPALVFFDEGGKEVYRLDSELLRERTEGSLQLVLEKGYLEEAQLQRWRQLKGRHAPR